MSEEDTCNGNGKNLRDFATFNRLKLTNTFFRKCVYKYTWTGKGYISLTDYTIIKKSSGGMLETLAYLGEKIMVPITIPTW